MRGHSDARLFLVDQIATLGGGVTHFNSGRDLRAVPGEAFFLFVLHGDGVLDRVGRISIPAALDILLDDSFDLGFGVDGHRTKLKIAGASMWRIKPSSTSDWH